MTLQPDKPIVVPRGTVLPPPPPGVRHVTVVRLGIVIADDELRRRVDRTFHWPMIILALLVLPLLAVEFFFRPQQWTLLWWISASALAVIWLAFLVEFVIKITIAECRLEYVKRNWLDLIILLLPALRPLRAAYIVRTSRVFTLRGVGMKFLRYMITIVVGMEATERMLQRIGIKSRAGRRKPDEMTRHELMSEVKKLRRLVDAWEDWHDAHLEHLTRDGREASAMAPAPDDTALEAESLDDAPVESDHARSA